MTPTRRALLLATLGLAARPGAGATPEPGCALLLLHGKWGQPQNLAGLAAALAPVCEVQVPEMPWSRRRGYDATYPQALAELAAQVQRWRAQGVRRVVLAGHSLGANAALAYMATHGDVDAVIALAPGHAPRAMYERGIGREAVNQAREAVAAGRGDEQLAMVDLNQGQRRTIRLRADVLWSYFDPAGLGDMQRSAAAFRQPVPLLWVVGQGDAALSAGPQAVFNLAPAHPLSRWQVVEADHLGTPEAAREPVLQWLRALP